MPHIRFGVNDDAKSHWFSLSRGAKFEYAHNEVVWTTFMIIFGA